MNASTKAIAILCLLAPGLAWAGATSPKATPMRSPTKSLHPWNANKTPRQGYTGDLTLLTFAKSSPFAMTPVQRAPKDARAEQQLLNSFKQPLKLPVRSPMPVRPLLATPAAAEQPLED